MITVAELIKYLSSFESAAIVFSCVEGEPEGTGNALERVEEINGHVALYFTENVSDF